MRTLRSVFACLVVAAIGVGLRASPAPEWQQEFQRSLPALGHRNWIVIVDSAYPLQNTPGVKLLVTGADHLTLVKQVLAAVHGAKHIRPHVYLDAELPYVAERYAPGIGQFRAGLAAALGSTAPVSLPHEQLIHRLDEAGRTFQVLVLKSTLTLPYTSVFIELECGYWSDQAEKALRQAMLTGRPPASE